VLGAAGTLEDYNTKYRAVDALVNPPPQDATALGQPATASAGLAPSTSAALSASAAKHEEQWRGSSDGSPCPLICASLAPGPGVALAGAMQRLAAAAGFRSVDPRDDGLWLDSPLEAGGNACARSSFVVTMKKVATVGLMGRIDTVSGRASTTIGQMASVINQARAVWRVQI
jgi:hypothetical protein